MLKIDNITKSFSVGTETRRALDGVSLNVKKGDLITIIGANGAGKSTLFNAIAGSFITDSGTITLDGQDITLMSEYKRARGIGRLFQDLPYDNAQYAVRIGTGQPHHNDGQRQNSYGCVRR